MKQALINLRGIKAGILTEDEDGYTFQYDTEFLQSDVAEECHCCWRAVKTVSVQWVSNL